MPERIGKIWNKETSIGQDTMEFPKNVGVFGFDCPTRFGIYTYFDGWFI